MLNKINNTSCFFHHVAAIVGKLAGIKLITTVQPCLLCNFKPAVQHIFLPSYYSGIHSNFKFLGDNDSVLFFVNVCT